jgi:hypothetical protein
MNQEEDLGKTGKDGETKKQARGIEAWSSREIHKKKNKQGNGLSVGFIGEVEKTRRRHGVNEKTTKRRALNP